MELSVNVRSSRPVFLPVAAIVVAMSLGPNCSSTTTANKSDGGNDVALGSGGEFATGGVPGLGGAQGLGGAPGLGGVQGSGGLSSSGGVGAGGTSRTGGVPGSGGAAGNGSGRGGAPGNGGTPSTGGVGGIGGAGGKSNTGGVAAGGATTIDASADGQGPKMGSPCRSQSDCGSSPSLLYCRAPGEALGCGMCRTGTDGCASDGDCAPDGGAAGARKICETAPSSSCYCKPTKLCVAGCRSKADCAAGEGCNASFACQATCSGNGDCPPDYACGSAGFCERKACASDAECSAACVKGACYGSLGACQAPAA